MATTENTFTGNGTLNSFAFTFPIIKRDDVQVSLNDTLIASTEYTFTNDTTIVFDAISPATALQETSGAPKSGVAVRVFRQTDVDDPVATFFAGSAIRAQDLNDNFLQVTYRSQEDENNNWNNSTETIKSDETWDSSDTKIATTAAMDQRFQDEATETILSSEAWPGSGAGDNDTIATTAAIENRVTAKIDAAITGDIATDGTGITVTDDGDGTITLGLANIDFDRIKADDVITSAEQDADPAGSDDAIFTSAAAVKRFGGYVQNDEPSKDGVGIGAIWVDIPDDKKLYSFDGTNWVDITSGGTFISLDKVIYVDATKGNDTSDGNKISSPKKTIRSALTAINADADGDGFLISVAPGIYAETLPLDIEKNDVAIIGQSLRTCIIHPAIPEADQTGYDVDTPEAQELTSMFRVNSGTYLQNLTFMGMKASGVRGAAGSLYTNATHGLPPNQGWNITFFPNATIRKSPYIQNCTNFSDSQINNVTFTPHTPGEGAAGDLDSAPTGGGILVDGSVPHEDSPLRSMVCDSYTHTALDGPGILVTNNGYCQATSSYAFFNHAHITCLNGGQANLAASTTDFGRFGLIADGRSPNAIFTSTVVGNFNAGVTTITVDAPAAGTDLYGGGEAWFGNAQRPATNMLIEIGANTYPILSCTANGDDWDVEISNPNANNRSTNDGLNDAISNGDAINFYLRSMIASSGHTMEYVGSGTNYNALPENGGVPDEADQKIELNDGKIWIVTTDHNGKLTVGGNQNDDPFFEVDQQLGFVTIPEGSISFNLVSDTTPQLGGDLDVQDHKITATGAPANIDIVVSPKGTGNLSVENAGIETDDDIVAQGDDVIISARGSAGKPGHLEIQEGTNVMSQTVPDSMTSGYTIVYPATAGSDNQMLRVNGAVTGGVHNMAWEDVTDTTKMPLAGGTFTGDVTLGAGSNLIFSDDDDSNTFTLQVPDDVTANTTFTLPAAGPTSAQELHLKATGTGDDVVLEWAEGGGGATGGGANTIFWENQQTVTEDYTITANTNAGSFGPITIDSGTTVTVPATSNWTIV